MDSSKFSFKLFLDSSKTFDLHALVPVLHSWIQMHSIPDHLLIDVADYAHVHDGPGIVLVSLEANYSIDTRGGKPGLTYQRKHPLNGSDQDRLRAAWNATLTAAALLQEHCSFKNDEFEFRICDRLNAPNTPETLAAITQALLAIWPGAKLTPAAKPDELFTLIVRPTQPITIPSKPS